MTQLIRQKCQAPLTVSGQRLDQAVAQMFPDYSREKLKNWIKDGALTLDGRTVRPNCKLAGGEWIELAAELEDQGQWQAEAMDLDLVYEDDALVVINKPANLVVHPAAGNYQGTLLNGLLHRYPELYKLARAGIVHRLDKDTTGLMVVARTLEAQNALSSQLQDRSVSREYVAVVHGGPPGLGTVDAPIGRDSKDRKKMAVRTGGKEAITDFKTLRRWVDFGMVSLKLRTGRTHQIRVHMAHLGFPLVGDPVYGKRLRGKNLLSPEALAFVQGFGRQALHARKLGLVHPITGDYCEWQTQLPDDLVALIDVLDDGAHSG